MAIFNCYVSSPEGTWKWKTHHESRSWSERETLAFPDCFGMFTLVGLMDVGSFFGGNNLVLLHGGSADMREVGHSWLHDHHSLKRSWMKMRVPFSIHGNSSFKVNLVQGFSQLQPTMCKELSQQRKPPIFPGGFSSKPVAGGKGRIVFCGAPSQRIQGLPSGKQPHNYGKSPSSMGQLTKWQFSIAFCMFTRG